MTFVFMCVHIENIYYLFLNAVSFWKHFFILKILNGFVLDTKYIH